MKKELLSFLIALLFVLGIILFSNSVYNYGKASMLDLGEQKEIKNNLEELYLKYINENIFDNRFAEV